MMVELTADGDLRMPPSVAEKYFPFGTLVPQRKGAELWLMPTRGAVAGGLILKQRTPEGERSVLIRDQFEGTITPGPRSATWDAWRGALRVYLEVRG